MKVYRFDIDSPGDIDAGIHGFTDTIIIIAEKGETGAVESEFKDFMKEALQEWNTSATITEDQAK